METTQVGCRRVGLTREPLAEAVGTQAGHRGPTPTGCLRPHCRGEGLGRPGGQPVTEGGSLVGGHRGGGESRVGGPVCSPNLRVASSVLSV